MDRPGYGFDEVNGEGHKVQVSVAHVKEDEVGEGNVTHPCTTLPAARSPETFLGGRERSSSGRVLDSASWAEDAGSFCEGEPVHVSELPDIVDPDVDGKQSGLMISAVRGLGFQLECIDASQIELKALLTDLNAKVDSLEASLSLSPPGRARDSDPQAAACKEGVPGSREDKKHSRSGKVSFADVAVRNGETHSPEIKKPRCSHIAPRAFQSFTEVLEPLPIREAFQECSQGSFGSSMTKQKSLARSPTKNFNWMASDSKRHGKAASSRFKAWSPESRSRTLLDFMGLLITGYDAFMVPYWLAWQSKPEEKQHWALGMPGATCIFWTIYLVLQLLTGFRSRVDARLELNLWRSALNYLKTWFMLDLIVVICDWLSILNPGIAGESSHFHYLRVMRLVRGARQVSKFVAMVQTYKLSSQFLEVHLSMDICLLLVFLLWVNHVVSCGWYSVGKHAYSDTGLTWLTDANFNSGHGSYYEYSTSLHWALTQMTPASMEVVPECTAERIYNLLTIIFSMLVFSSFGATLTSSLTQYRLHRERVTTNFMQLQTYLGQQGVEPELGMAIRLQVKNHLRKRQRLNWKNVTYLDYVSKALKEALWHSCCMKCIRQHALLHALNLHDPGAVNIVCNTAITTTSYSQGDIVFELGIETTNEKGCMHFLVCGRMFYDPGPKAAEAGRSYGDPLLTVGEGAFVSEVALWTEHWKHLGTLFVEVPSEVLQLRGDKLVEALYRRFPETMRIVSHYSVVFHARMHERGCVRSDLAHIIDCHDLISALETPIRMELANPIMDKLRSRGGRFRDPKSLEMLDSELRAGKCNIGIEDDEPVRTVSLVAVKLWRAVGDDCFLVKVGEHMRNGDVKASCALPGKKRVGKESARVVMERTLETDLAELKHSIDVYPGSDKTIFMKDSASYGVRTRYLRTTYNAVLDEDCDLPVASCLWVPQLRASDLVRSKELLTTYSSSGQLGARSSSSPKNQVRRCFSRFLNPCGFFPNQGGLSTTAEAFGLNSGTNSWPNVKRTVVDILANQEQAILLACDEDSKTKFTINIWLTQEEFSALSNEVAITVIQDWLTSVGPREQASQGRKFSEGVDSAGFSRPMTESVEDGGISFRRSVAESSEDPEEADSYEAECNVDQL